MLVLGIESSCDETGVALYDSTAGRLLAHALHSQIAMHQAYGGVVPELASRDHIRRLVPLLDDVLEQAQCKKSAIDVIAHTRGPGLAGALLVGTGFAYGLGFALGRPLIGIHHLEGHLLSPLLSDVPPKFPFVALLVSGGHTQLMRVEAVGDYRLLGETMDDAAGEAFDKTAKLLGLPYPGGPALSRMAEFGNPSSFALPRPMLRSGTLDFSFSGLKTAVLSAVRDQGGSNVCEQTKADIAASFQEAIVEVLCAKTLAAVQQTGLERLVVAGGVGANRRLREALQAAASTAGIETYFPELQWCTDNGAMIALAGALRIESGLEKPHRASGFSIKPRWELTAVNVITEPVG
ncbi:MAG: tRNA (adenosine(37)-N6)-threonylcarbamoyltransferase complex transferase subunit TsaD [Burkholderiaceae bacterium]